MKTVGWYHSHPYFKTTPSYIDKQTHEVFTREYNNVPYLGIIMGKKIYKIIIFKYFKLKFKL